MSTLHERMNKLEKRLAALECKPEPEPEKPQPVNLEDRKPLEWVDEVGNPFRVEDKCIWFEDDNWILSFPTPEAAESVLNGMGYAAMPHGWVPKAPEGYQVVWEGEDGVKHFVVTSYELTYWQEFIASKAARCNWRPLYCIPLPQ